MWDPLNCENREGKKNSIIIMWQPINICMHYLLVDIYVMMLMLWKWITDIPSVLLTITGDNVGKKEYEKRLGEC